MNINKINTHNQVNPLEKLSKTASKHNNTLGTSSISDNVDIDHQNTKVADLMKIKKLVQEADEIRLDKVEQAKSNLEAYFKDGKINSDIVDKIAKNISTIIE